MSFRLRSPAFLFRKLRPPAFVRVPFMLSYILVLSIFLAVFVEYFRIQPQVPLFYSLARPAEQLVPKLWIFLIPAVLTVITLGHLSLIYKYHDYDQLLLQLFAWTTLGIDIVISLALIRVLVIIS